MGADRWGAQPLRPPHLVPMGTLALGAGISTLAGLSLRDAASSGVTLVPASVAPLSFGGAVAIGRPLLLWRLRREGQANGAIRLKGNGVDVEPLLLGHHH